VVLDQSTECFGIACLGPGDQVGIIGAHTLTLTLFRGRG
jgi:hypothetical protein